MNHLDDIMDPVPAGFIPASPGGSGLKRFLALARFLDAAISDMDSAIAAGGDRTAAQWVNS
ncbi:hypothetical protein [uncultured Hoeflea sp.]|uniref:hypothetical protein n=1 Tax=uncultured Hoeflea sp. TaxID=538666 RepID=UPI002621870D|nr:hypothetical protein [uncultured Hoeflea sp.]